MKKFMHIFLIFALLIATFDVIDANDITLCDDPVFTSEDLSVLSQDDDQKDNISGNYNSVISFKLVFNLPEIKPIVFDITSNFKKNDLRSIAPHLYNEYSNNLYRPPIA